MRRLPPRTRPRFRPSRLSPSRRSRRTCAGRRSRGRTRRRPSSPPEPKSRERRRGRGRGGRGDSRRDADAEPGFGRDRAGGPSGGRGGAPAGRRWQPRNPASGRAPVRAELLARAAAEPSPEAALSLDALRRALARGRVLAQQPLSGADRGPGASTAFSRARPAASRPSNRGGGAGQGHGRQAAGGLRGRGEAIGSARTVRDGIAPRRSGSAAPRAPGRRRGGSGGTQGPGAPRSRSDARGPAARPTPARDVVAPTSALVPPARLVPMPSGPRSGAPARAARRSKQSFRQAPGAEGAARGAERGQALGDDAGGPARLDKWLCSPGSRRRARRRRSS